MSEPRARGLLERLRRVSHLQEYEQELCADIDAYLAAPPAQEDRVRYLCLHCNRHHAELECPSPPAQPPRVTAEGFAMRCRCGKVWSNQYGAKCLECGTDANVYDARLSAEREPPDIEAHPKYHVRSGHVFPKDGSACVLCEAEREPGEAGT